MFKTLTTLKDAQLVVKIPPEIAAPIRSYERCRVRNADRTSDLAAYGRPWMPRVVVKTIEGNVDVDAIAAAVEGFGPLRITLGPTRILHRPTDDLLYVEVVPADAWQMNWLLSTKLGWDRECYMPRLDIASLAKGRGEAYAGDVTFMNADFTVEELSLFSLQRLVRTVQL